MSLSHLLARILPIRKSRKERPQAKPSRERAVRLMLEALEDRTLPSVLPAPIVDPTATAFASNTTTNIVNAHLTNVSDPKIAYDPNNPLHLVAVFNATDNTNGGNSNNAGGVIVLETGVTNAVTGVTTWSAPIEAITAQVDPTQLQPGAVTPDQLNSGQGIPHNFNYTESSNASIAFDRQDNIYVLAVLHNAAYTSGELALSKYHIDVNTGAATVVANPNVNGVNVQNENLQQWLTHDPIYNPVVAVDDNLASQTDALTGATTGPTTTAGDAADHNSDNVVWVFWDTDVAGSPPDPYGVKAMVSTNGGVFVANPATGQTNTTGDDGVPTTVTSFSTPLYVDSYNYTTIVNNNPVNNSGDTGPILGGVNPNQSLPGIPLGAPVVLFTAPSVDGTVQGGEMIVAYTDSLGHIIIDRYDPSQGNTNTVVSDTYNFLTPGGAIVDAQSHYNVDSTGKPTSRAFPDTPDATAFSFTINSTDPNLIQPTSIVDANVTVELAAAHLSDISIDLYAPGNVYTPGALLPDGGFAPGTSTNPNATIRLLWNRFGTNNNGQVTNFNGNENPLGLGDDPANGGNGLSNQLGVIAIPIPGDTPNGIQQYQYIGVGTVFDQQAAVKITDGTTASPYVGYYRPELNGFSPYTIDLGNLFGLNALNGNATLTPAGINGTWTLVVTDNYNETAAGGFDQNHPNGTDPASDLLAWGIQFDSNVNTNYFLNDPAQGLTGLTTDTVVSGATTVAASPTDTYAQQSPATANAGAPNGSNFGIGPSLSIAQDKSVGSYSPYEGRVYISYTGPGRTNFAAPNSLTGVADNTDVYLIASDNAGTSWNALATAANNFQTAVRVNNDSFSDAIDSEGNRPQFDSAVAVDPVTGTVVVSWYDARYDAANARVAEYVADSIDGGDTFGANVYLNINKTADDLLTNSTVNLEPIPDNMSLTNNGVLVNGVETDVIGFGESQGLTVYDGRVIDLWTGNQNAAGVEILTDGVSVNRFGVVSTAPVEIAAGPRVVSGDSGAVTADFTDANTGTVYNNVYAADGSRELTAFEVVFDRPVVINSFTTAMVDVEYRSPIQSTGGPSSPVAVGSIVAMDAGNFGSGFGPHGVGAAATNTLAGIYQLATTFLVYLATPQSNVGTYSYAIGSATVGGATIFDYVSDGSKTRPDGGAAIAPAGNKMDQNNDGKTDEGDGSAALGSDRFANPSPEDGVPFQLPYDPNTLPLILPGPHVVSTYIPGAPGSPGSADTQVNTTPQAITAFGTTSSNITFTDNFLIQHVGLNLNLTFPTDADLTITLTTPGVNGTTITLFDGFLAGANYSGFSNTTFDGLANQHIEQTRSEALPANYTGGFFIPAESLDAALDGQLSAGTYTLTITNNGSNSGQLLNWSLTLAKQDNEVVNNTVSAITVVFDRDINPATFTPAQIVRIMGPNGLINGPFVVTPGASLPNVPPTLKNRTFQINFATQQLSGQYTVVLSSAITSLNPDYPNDPNTGDALDSNLNAGLGVLETTVTNLAQATQVATPYQSNNTKTNTAVPIPVAPNSTTPSVAEADINVTDSYVVQNATIQLTINFPHGSEITASLMAPDGTTVQLFSFQGSPTQNGSFSQTLFSDSGTQTIQSGSSPYIGSFTPQFPLAALNGHGSFGVWKLLVQNNSTNDSGSIGSVTLNLTQVQPGTGLGEPVADQYSTGFRIFTEDPTNPLSQDTWTGVGPVAQDGSGNAASQTAGNPTSYSRADAIAVDPNDPSGNTVYVGTAVGGLWKTTNFLTTDPAGPTYVSLTDFGPNQGMNIASIAVVPTLGDPNKSVLVVGTGDPTTEVGAGSNFPGVGFLYSADGGATWVLEDSLVNYDAQGKLLALSARKHDFVGDVVNKIIVDPNTSGNGVLYAAISGPNNPGLYKSTDGGKDWTLLRAGNATDVAFSLTGPKGSDGLLQILYAGFANDGAYVSFNEGQSFTQMAGQDNQGRPVFQDNGSAYPPAAGHLVPANPPNSLPTGASRILLATPTVVANNPLENQLLESWVYALTPNGLYESKDFGDNWTQVDLTSINTVNNTVLDFYPTNDETSNPYGLPALFGNQSTFDLSLAVDPNNPEVVYLGGNRLLRVNLTNVADAHNFVGFDNSNADGGLAQTATTGSIFNVAKTTDFAISEVVQDQFGNIRRVFPAQSSDLNVERDPQNPFSSLSTLVTRDTLGFGNTGQGATYQVLSGISPSEFGYHSLLALPDPLNGDTRLFIGGQEGVWTGVDESNVTVLTSIGATQIVTGSRNGNLQIAELTQGAVQPSSLASDISGALFLASTSPQLIDPGATDQSFPQSDGAELQNGDLVWSVSSQSRQVGNGGVGVAFDPNGSGTAYYYAFPREVSFPETQNDFFQLGVPGQTLPISRTSGLDPTDRTQWPLLVRGSTFALNPADPGVNPTSPGSTGGIVMSSQTGAVYLTTSNGNVWSQIFSTGDGSYGQAVAFGAPPAGSTNLDGFIYVGTTGGHIYVTLNGGGTWVTTAGLDGAPVRQIVTDPTGGKFDAYAVTASGVWYLADARVATPTWTNITANLFALTVNEFGNALLSTPFMTARSVNDPSAGLTALAVDWRSLYDNTPGVPSAGTHPILYVGGLGGVVRSDDGGKTWSIFPNAVANGSARDGGQFPNVLITSLQLSQGNINSQTGIAGQATGYDVLLATTLGRGAFAIRLANNQIAGPTILSVTPNESGGSVASLDVQFSEAIDASTFTLADITSFTGPNGAAITPLSIVEDTANEASSNLHTLFLVTFAPQAANGTYTITIGPNVSDLSGDKMNQNANGVNGENPGDAFTGRFLINGTTATGNVPALFAFDTTNGAELVDVDNQGGTKNTQNLSFFDVFPSSVTWVNVHTGDFNGDGLADTLGMIAENGQIWVSLSNPANTGVSTAMWAALTPDGTASQPFANYVNFTVADFNGDGKADFAVYNKRTGQWLVGLSNNSGFNVSVWAQWNPNTAYQNVMAGDFNGDGRADLIAQEVATGNWDVALSTGTSFQPLSLWAGGFSPSRTWVTPLVADFNGDGLADFEVRDLGNGLVYVGLSNGTNGFSVSVWAQWDPTQTWTNVMAGDFNGATNATTGDRIEGIFAFDANPSQDAYYAGVSTGSKFLWRTWAYFGPSYNMVSPGIGDFNHDGKDDMAALDSKTGRVFVGLSNGSTGFAENLGEVLPLSVTQTIAGVTTTTAVSYVDAQVADYDGNTTPDYLIRQKETGQWILGLSAGGTFKLTETNWALWTPPAPTWTDVVYGNFTGNGRTDVAARVLQTGQWFVAADNGLNGYMSSVWTTWYPGYTWVNVTTGDFNGDGKTDIMGRALEPDVLYVNLSLGSAFQQGVWANLGAGNVWDSFTVGDFNGDGKDDLVARLVTFPSSAGPQTADDLVVFVSNGVSGFNAQFGGALDQSQTLVSVQKGNFTGAGSGVQFATLYGNGRWNVWTYSGSTSGNFFNAPSNWVTWPANSSQWTNITVGDFNGDGKTDLLAYDPTTSNWYVSLSTGTSFQPPSVWTTFGSPNLPLTNVQVGDLNGDGKADFLAYYAPAGYWFAGISNGSNAFQVEVWDQWDPSNAYKYTYLARTM